MKVTESEKRKIVRIVAPGASVEISDRFYPKETWTASEVFLNDGGLSISCAFQSDWGRKFTHTIKDPQIVSQHPRSLFSPLTKGVQK